MNRMKKSGIALLMAFMLCIGVIPVYAVNASDDTSKPQIESVVFHDDGKTVKEYDEVSFTVKSNIAASDISCFMVGFSTEDYGIGSMASFEEVDINTYLVKITISGFVGQAVSANIDLYDKNWNLVSYALDDISFKVEENIADVEGEITLSKDNVVIDEDDFVEGGTGIFYQEKVEVALTIQGKYADVYSSAYAEYEYGAIKGNSLSLHYDASSSTDTVTVYKGEIFFNQFSVADECVIGNVYLQRTENGHRELVQCSGKTLQVTRGFEDQEAPQLIDVSIDRQGETIKDGKIVITVKATDNVAIGQGDEYDYVSVVMCSPLFYVDADQYFSLESQGNDIYTVEIDLDEWRFYQCEWFIYSIALCDTVGNKTVVKLGQESPYYFYIEKDGECFKEVFSNLTLNLLDNTGKEITSVTKDMERRTTIGDILGTEYLDGTKTNLGEFLGWSTEKGGKVLDKDTQFLIPYDSENTTFVNLYEVYEKGETGETPEQPTLDSKVTIVEDKKTEEAVQQETQKVVADIVAGNVSNSVVDEKTAEKVTEAINSGQTVTAEIIVKEVEQNEIAQNEQNAIEEKVTSVLGADAKVQYLDVAIVLKAGEEELGTLNELEEEITITVAIPEELKAEGRTYKVIRNHDGEIAVLDTVVNEDGTISFKTDCFSTYALAYADEEETGINPNPDNKPTTDGKKDTNTNTNANTNQSDKTAPDEQGPQTGDNSSVMIYVVICFVALATIVVTKKKNLFTK